MNRFFASSRSSALTDLTPISKVEDDFQRHGNRTALRADNECGPAASLSRRS